MAREGETRVRILARAAPAVVDPVELAALMAGRPVVRAGRAWGLARGVVLASDLAPAVVLAADLSAVADLAADADRVKAMADTGDKTGPPVPRTSDFQPSPMPVS